MEQYLNTDPMFSEEGREKIKALPPPELFSFFIAELKALAGIVGVLARAVDTLAENAGLSGTVLYAVPRNGILDADQVQGGDVPGGES
jgi:hypothetical protein